MNYQAEINKKLAELKELQEKQEEYNNLSSAQKLAIELHACMCKANHTDGCGWYYEFVKNSHVWTGNEHSSYLHRADEILKFSKHLQISDKDLTSIITFISNQRYPYV